MKLMMFAALAAAVATPVMAQSTTAPTPDPSMQTAPTADPATAQPAPTPMTPPPADTSSTTTGSGAMASMPADGAYPMCTRTMKDHCTERSNAKGARLHSTPRG